MLLHRPCHSPCPHNSAHLPYPYAIAARFHSPAALNILHRHHRRAEPPRIPIPMAPRHIPHTDNDETLFFGADNDDLHSKFFFRPWPRMFILGLVALAMGDSATEDRRGVYTRWCVSVPMLRRSLAAINLCSVFPASPARPRPRTSTLCAPCFLWTRPFCQRVPSSSPYLLLACAMHLH